MHKARTKIPRLTLALLPERRHRLLFGKVVMACLTLACCYVTACYLAGVLAPSLWGVGSLPLEEGDLSWLAGMNGLCVALLAFTWWAVRSLLCGSLLTLIKHDSPRPPAE